MTSHTTKALRVLRDHVVEDLRPLCVSVLESDMDSRKQLESAVHAIAERLTDADADSLARQAAQFGAERKRLLQQLRITRQSMLTARSGEYREIVVSGQGILPSQAARRVAAGIGKHDWIPGPVTAGVGAPLSDGDLIELYGTNASVAESDESEIDSPLPEPSSLIAPGEFENLIQERQRLNAKDINCGKEFWHASISASTESLTVLLGRLQSAVDGISEQQPWRLRLIEIGKKGEAHRDPWDKFLANAKAVEEEAARAQEIVFEHGPALSGTIELHEQVAILSEVHEFTAEGKSIGWFTLLTRSKWKRVIETVTVSDRRPTSAEHFRALHQFAQLQHSRMRLADGWKRMVESIGAQELAELSETPERECVKLSGLIENSLDWHNKTWTPLLHEMREMGFDWEGLLREADPNTAKDVEPLRIQKLIAKRLPAIFEARVRLLTFNWISKSLTKLQHAVDSFCGERTALVVRHLKLAVKEGDCQRYRDAYARLSDLQNRRNALQKRRELLRRLETAAPSWAAAIRSRTSPHESALTPGDVAEAWIFRQMEQELRRRAEISYDELQKRCEELTTQLHRCTTSYIDRLTWEAQIRRTTLKRKQALIGWLQAVKAKGKGTGNRIRVLKLEAEARRLMSECQSAVPVWIMPISRVVENFNPARDRVDVVIIDEASQADVMALVALYFGKRVVIVGDHEQVSPDAVGQRVDEVLHLIESHLKDVPNRLLYDGKLSVYDLAQASFGGSICLREHFRCVPDIIQFSNRLSYDGRILPLRDDSRVVLKPHVIEHRVTGDSRDGKINREEAETIASLVAAAIEQPEYESTRREGKVMSTTFGVVSLLGDEQALEIEKILRRHLEPAVLAQRRIVCGNSAQFQGDERDVMFLSVVDVPGDGPLSLRTDDRFKKRFNVAASRAKDQMWIVHSLDPLIDLKPGDLRRRIIEFARNPKGEQEVLSAAKQSTESEFERQVYLRLSNAGFELVPQFKVGAYRIDFVVKGRSGAQVALECDGDRFHPIEKLPDDMARQAVLERLGWKFIRIRGSEFFRDPQKAMDIVFTRLATLGIEASDEKFADEKSQNRALIERVNRRASEIRAGWTEEAAATPDALQEQPAAYGRRSFRNVSSGRLTPSLLNMDKKNEPDLFTPEPQATATRRLEDRLKEKLASLLPRDFYQCPKCKQAQRLWLGKRGPFLKCVNTECGDSLNVPVEFTTEALKQLDVRCPECKSIMAAHNAGRSTVFRCSERGHSIGGNLIH